MDEPAPPAVPTGVPPVVPPAVAGSDPPTAGGVGNAVDWVEALARHGRWLRRVVFARLGEAGAVEEVMQEVSLAAAAKGGGVAGPAQAGAWLYRVAVRQAVLYRRGLGRRRRLLDGFARRGGSAPPDAGGSGPLQWLLSAERDELVRRALRRLPKRDADVLVLKYTEQWSYQELADHLGISPVAVQARLHRARQRLRGEVTRLRLHED